MRNVMFVMNLCPPEGIGFHGVSIHSGKRNFVISTTTTARHVVHRVNASSLWVLPISHLTLLKIDCLGSRWVILSDGREICSDCSRTMIIDTNYCQPLYLDVLELYRSLQLELPSRPPLMLVDRPALNERSSGQGHGGGPQTRGMTLAEEYR